MSRTILIVEDEAIVARDLKGRLTRLGYSVVGTAAHGDKAIELAEQLRPELVLMDIHLQGDMDGVQAAAAIHARYDIPVVFVTANADNATLQRALATEPFGYILKPFNERELHTAIEMALYKHQSERKLRASEANKAAIMAAAMDGIITTDLEGHITEFNPSAERIFGLRRADALGTSAADLLMPDSRDSYQREVSQLLAAPDGCVSGRRLELQALRAGGAGFTAETSLSRTEREDRPTVISFWRDLSQTKLLERQMLQGQKMQLVGQLAGGIAHDFNNLLTVINGHAEALFMSMRADFRACGRVQEITKAGERAAKLTGQLLAFSRQQVLKPRVLNLNDLLTDVQRMLSRLLGTHITLTAKLCPDLGPVQVDPSQIEQVLMNLVVNARDAMPRGGQLIIETANAELDESYARMHPEVKPGPYALVAVSDTGCGMDKATQARIFEPFFTTKGPGKATGLGLATAYGIIKQSGGYIYVYSEPGHGTSFKVYLPFTNEAVSMVRPVSLTAPAGGREVVLMAEDEDGVRSLLRMTLEAKGYTVLEAANGQDALEVAKRHGRPIPLLLTGVVMPGIGGRELAEQFAATYPQTRVLYMSGYTHDIVVSHSTHRADFEFIQKPFTMNALLHKVRALLDQAKDNQANPQGDAQRNPMPKSDISTPCEVACEPRR